MAEPGGQAMTGIVLHRPHFGSGAERVGHALCRPFVIGREAHARTSMVNASVLIG